MWHCVQIGVKTVSWICWKSELPDGLPLMGSPLASSPWPLPAVQAASSRKHGANKIPFTAMKLVERTGMPVFPVFHTRLRMGNTRGEHGSAPSEKNRGAVG